MDENIPPEVSEDWRLSLRNQIADLGLRNSPDNIWALVTCRNEMEFLPGFFAHHRSIGINNYIFIDDESTDGSREFLEQQHDVTLLRINARYPEYKHEFRSIICDEAFEGKWVLFLDVDERFVYRAMESMATGSLLSKLEREGHGAALAIMVDAYRLEPDSEFNDTEALSTQGYWFDSTSYRAVYTNTATQRNWPTPPFDYFGGAQERLFFCSPVTTGNAIERALASYSLNTVGAVVQPQNSVTRRIFSFISNRLKRFSNGCATTPPKQNKVVLLRWEKGCRFSGGVHRVNTKPSLWHERTALLHLKIKDGYEEKVLSLANQESHAGKAEIYKQILAGGLEHNQFRERVSYHGSMKFRSSKDLEKAGLL